MTQLQAVRDAMPRGVLFSIFGMACAFVGLGYPLPGHTAAPILYNQPAYQSPVCGEPDDLLHLAGYGFAAGDIVVYQVLGDTTRPLITPASVTATSTAMESVAPVVCVTDAPCSLTIS
jgi:hypothetical protein